MPGRPWLEGQIHPAPNQEVVDLRCPAFTLLAHSFSCTPALVSVAVTLGGREDSPGHCHSTILQLFHLIIQGLLQLKP